ncbi:hypothetical protein D1007_09935 [Hordeum vulgare]|nr:hypothetical protein D1007_09935 [Hordeum vulgare]
MAVVAGGCAELRAVCRPVEVRGVAAVMADAELAHSEAVEHAMPCVLVAGRPRRTCVVAQRLRWRGMARWRGGEAVRAAGEAARAAMLLASGRGMCGVASSRCSAFVAVEEDNRRRSPELENVRRASPDKELGVCRRRRKETFKARVDGVSCKD